jgi:DNA-binding ferritin-like protein
VRREAAEETLALGEEPLDSVIAAAAHTRPEEPFPEAEVREALEELFAALREMVNDRASAPYLLPDEDSGSAKQGATRRYGASTLG